MASLTPELARENNPQANAQLKLLEVEGALVLQVLPKTPAAASSLRPGDVIVEMNGQKVTNTEQLQQVAAKSQVGEVLNLKVRRGNQVVSLSVSIGNLRETN